MCIRDRFTNVAESGVISVWDADTIYKVPRMLHEQRPVSYTHLRAHEHLRISYAVFCLKKKTHHLCNEYSERPSHQSLNRDSTQDTLNPQHTIHVSHSTHNTHDPH